MIEVTLEKCETFDYTPHTERSLLERGHADRRD
jgi:hypothetical protein